MVVGGGKKRKARALAPHIRILCVDRRGASLLVMRLLRRRVLAIVPRFALPYSCSLSSGNGFWKTRREHRENNNSLRPSAVDLLWRLKSPSENQHEKSYLQKRRVVKGFLPPIRFRVRYRFRRIIT